MSSDNPINRFLTELVGTLVSVMEKKDDYLREHGERVAELCVGFTKTLKLSEQAKVEKIYFGGLLHDIGMVYVSSETLNKPGPLEEGEMAVIHQHPILGSDIISNMTILQDVAPMFRHHHEAFDGSGYPEGLKGNAIPLGARMLAIVDSYDAMTSARPYRKAVESEKALAALVEDAGKHYDRDLVKRFVRFIRNGGTLQRRQAAEENEAAASVKEIIQEIIAQFKEGKITLPVLPRVVQDVDAVLNNPTAKSDELVAVIERDAVISIRLISVANSPYYRGLEQITSVRTAISRIGQLETRKLVTAIASKSLYETKNIKFRRLMERLWLHGLSSGYAAVGIARHLGLADAETYFFIGLVHEIGRVVLFKTLSERLPVTEPMDMGTLRASVAPFYPEFGSAMLKRWKYAATIIKAVAQHTATEISEEMPRESLVLHLANTVANHLDYRVFDEDPNAMPSQSPIALALNMGPDALKDIAESVRRIMQEAAQFF